MPRRWSALDDLLDLDLVRPTEVPRRFIFRHPLVRRSGLRVDARRLAAGGPLPRRGGARRARGERGRARAPRRAIRRAGRRRRRSRSCSRPAAAAAGRAPAAAARWFEAALRLLPGGDRERQVEVRVAFASALRSIGELERCREVLLEAIDMLGADDVPRRRRADRAVRRGRALAGPPRRGAPPPDPGLGGASRPRDAESAALQIELAVDGLYAARLRAGGRRWARARSRPRGALGDPALIAAAASALCARRGQRRRRIEDARAHLEEALEQIERLSDEELAPRLDAFYYLGWAENYLEHYDDAARPRRARHRDRPRHRRGAAADPADAAQGLPVRDAGPPRRGGRGLRDGGRGARLSANPHYLFWALFELGLGALLLRRPERGDRGLRGERAASASGWPAARCPPRAAGPAGRWRSRCCSSGESRAGLELMQELGSEEIEFAVPVERCFDWENLALARAGASATPEAAEAHVQRAEELAAGLDGLHLPAASRGRARAAVLLHEGEAKAAIAPAAGSASKARRRSGRGLQAAFSRSLLGQALAGAGEREQAIAALREAERELDACGSLRERDEVRRELRKLGARAEARGPAAGESRDRVAHQARARDRRAWSPTA